MTLREQYEKETGQKPHIYEADYNQSPFPTWGYVEHLESKLAALQASPKDGEQPKVVGVVHTKDAKYEVEATNVDGKPQNVKFRKIKQPAPQVTDEATKGKLRETIWRWRMKHTVLKDGEAFDILANNLFDQFQAQGQLPTDAESEAKMREWVNKFPIPENKGKEHISDFALGWRHCFEWLKQKGGGE